MHMPKPHEHTFEEIALGDRESFVVRITAEMIDTFAEVSGDYNPLHVDEARPGGRIAHGMLSGALFSRFVGMYLPGLNCLYLSQSLKFKKPIRPNTEAEVEGVVTAKNNALRTLTIALAVKEKASGDALVEGEALVRVME